MTWLARSRSGTSIPMSRAASWMHCTMVPAESMSVPSQSKTMREYFIESAQGSPEGLSHERCHVQRQLGLEFQLPLFERMLKGKPGGVKEQPLQPFLPQ